MDTATTTPFSHTTAAGTLFYLNVRHTPRAAGEPVAFYYFSKTIKPDTAVADLPAGYTVTETRGMPVLKRTP